MAERCAIFARVSSKMQEAKENPIAGQLLNCRNLAAQRGYTVVQEFQETASGYADIFERKGLQDLWRLVDRQQIDVILVDDMDRLTRKREYRSYLRVYATRHRIRIEAVTGIEEDSLGGRLAETFRAEYAEYEAVARRHRTARGRQARAEMGKPISASLPYGYRWNDPETRKKSRMVIAEPEAAIVRRIFQTLADGGTATSLMYTLNAEGVPIPKPRAGGLNVWSTRTIGRIVRNEAYLGKAWAFKSESRYENGRRIRLADRPESERIALPDGTIPRLISDDLFNKAAERLIRNRREATRNARKPDTYLLRGGFAKCFHCGGTLEACIAPRGDRYYRCIPAQRRKHGCPSCSIRAEELETAVWDRVLFVLESPDYILRHAKQQAESDTTADQIDTLDRALVELSGQTANLLGTAALAIDEQSRAFIAGRLDDIAEQRRNLSARRQHLLDLQAAHERTKARMANLSGVFAKRLEQITGMTMGERRDTLVDFGVSVTVYPKGSERRYIIDMAFNAEIDARILADLEDQNYPPEDGPWNRWTIAEQNGIPERHSAPVR